MIAVPDGEKMTMAMAMAKLPAVLQLQARALQAEAAHRKAELRRHTMGCPLLLGRSMRVGERGHQPCIQARIRVQITL